MKIRAREKQAQQWGETLITPQTNARRWQGSAVGKPGNQIASPEPCPSVGVAIHTCKSTSTKQRLKERGTQKMTRGKRFQLRLQIRVASIIINIKTEILPHSGSQVLCFKEKKKKGKPQISLSQKSCLNFVLSLNSCSFKFWRSPFNLCLDQSNYAVGASTKNLIPTLNLVHHYPQQYHYLF